MAFKITIPEPCHENWHEMTPTQKGAFCDTCEKEVIDFTAYSNYELARKLGRGEKLCGRFRASQLDTPLPTLEPSRWRERMAALGFTALLAGSCSPEPVQDPEVVVIAVETHDDHIPPPVVGKIAPEEVVTISGTVKDNSGNLPGTLITLTGTDYATEADPDGKYELQFPAELLQEPKSLLFTQFGFLAFEKTITSETSCANALLTEDDMPLGAVEIIMGDIAVSENDQ